MSLPQWKDRCIKNQKEIYRGFSNQLIFLCLTAISYRAKSSSHQHALFFEQKKYPFPEVKLAQNPEVEIKI